MAQTGHRRDGAFTLIELMVVVALIGIMTAMIIPEMKGTYEDALLRSTSRELINACQLAYSRAVSFNQPHRLRLNPKTGRYIIERRAVEDGREIFIPLRNVSGSEGKLDTRIAIQTEESSDDVSQASLQQESTQGPGGSEPSVLDELITFYPDGTADAGTIVLRDRDGFRLALRINPITARVHITELARE